MTVSISDGVLEASGVPTELARLTAGVRRDIAARRDSIGLAAFENVMSRSARSMLACDLSDRYLIGLHSDRAAGRSLISAGLMLSGYPGVDDLERAATGAARRMFGAAWVDFRPLSGLHATVCTVSTMTRPGDLVYSIAPADGGHFATRGMVESFGRLSAYLPFGSIAVADVDAFAAAWTLHPGRMIIFDHGTPLRALPLPAIREVVGPDVLLVYDASHTLGLIAGGLFQDPLREGCDVLQGNTHKSFPGAHKGVIAFRDGTVGRRVSAAIGATLVSSQNTGATLANFVATLEMAEYGRSYARQMVRNSAALVRELRGRGALIDNVTGTDTASDSHVLLVDALASRSGYELGSLLIGAGVHVNARPINGRVVVRLGVQEVTRLGFEADTIALLADLMTNAAAGQAPGRVRADVAALSRDHREVRYSFDVVDSSLDARPDPAAVHRRAMPVTS